MKTLVESLFDKDIIQKDVEGHQIKDVANFDGQWVYRIKRGQQVNLYFEKIKDNNVLEVLDWNKIRKDLKRHKGDKIDLGMYPWAGSDGFNIKNAKTDKKTEMLARFIMSIPTIEKLEFGGFNRKWREEIEGILNEYILPQFRGVKSGWSYTNFYWTSAVSKYTLAISLRYGSYGDQDLIRLEFSNNEVD